MRGSVRIIPILLLRDWGLEKTIRFRDPVYVGSPINAARVFNGMNVDELILLDVIATEKGRGANLEIVSQIAEESFMPITVGGGVRDRDGIRTLLSAGADRVVINSAAVEYPSLIREAADTFGRQCIVVSIDAIASRDGTSYEVVTRRGSKRTGIDVREHAEAVAREGAGEILINSVERDGTMSGYDLRLIRQVADAVDIPVIACGGAGTVGHLAEAVEQGNASAVAAGAFFLFFGARRTVLLSYPSDDELDRVFPTGTIRPKRSNPVVLPEGVVRR